MKTHLVSPQFKDFAYALEEVSTMSNFLVIDILREGTPNEHLMLRALEVRDLIRNAERAYDKLSSEEKKEWHCG